MLLVGIDSVEIDRIEKSLIKKSFLKIFSEKEISALYKKNFSPRSAAACFAAKEAFGKALGVGIFSYPLSDVSLLHEENGKPYIKIDGKAAELDIVKQSEFAVSVTHTENIATVVVVGMSKR